ncbi:MAG TPA: zf-HC2 domain-containing protein [Ktedonobacterales bacterium]|jgi:anti-sigma factor RsiW
MVDYHFGRLSPEMNAAVEQHVRSCERCQAEGLRHLATEKRSALRLARRGPQGRSGGLPRVIALIAALVLLALFLYLLTHPGARTVGLPPGALAQTRAALIT